ncbi:hypothetical protein [Streptomyces dysideae]|uniref:hypothetical protein n=1 Tax=Streptomyces dysideae TaxID=909626 RepID=UPI000AB60640|nr:hypothetical protein [Streptomyces dysideae]
MRGAARALHYEVAYLRRVLNGNQRPSPKPAKGPDRLVRADGALLALDELLPLDDALKPRHAAWRIGARDVAELAGRVHGLRLAHDVLAGGDVIEGAIRELHSVIRLYKRNSHSEDAGRARSRVVLRRLQETCPRCAASTTSTAIC